MQIKDFIQTLRDYYRSHGRHDLPWRSPEADGSFDPYKILVSEIMLQQTQVSRVLPKYEAFIRELPTVQALAATPLGIVLVAWQGLGYNRRAKYLWQAAQMVMGDFGGVFPCARQTLTKLPGVGNNTAGAVMAYAYNKPAAFVETNIRTVYIHHFFHDQTGVADKDILALVAETLEAWMREEHDNNTSGGGPGLSRTFYWALMDYGTYLKQTVGNKSRASMSYAKQSKFTGSVRQLRGKVLRVLAAGPLGEAALVKLLSDERTHTVLAALTDEGMVRRHSGLVELP
ncbi:MAG TPA: hypothetical protein VFT53_05965 [Candidatus Saccharimonadales bacterium]|nr:hypothetical protein [Candidatus Saccharimonadales bacterium]